MVWGRGGDAVWGGGGGACGRRVVQREEGAVAGPMCNQSEGWQGGRDKAGALLCAPPRATAYFEALCGPCDRLARANAREPPPAAHPIHIHTQHSHRPPPPHTARRCSLLRRHAAPGVCRGRPSGAHTWHATRSCSGGHCDMATQQRREKAHGHRRGTLRGWPAESTHPSTHPPTPPPPSRRPAGCTALPIPTAGALSRQQRRRSRR